MSDVQLDQSAITGSVGRGLAWLSRQFALAGGFIMLALATMTVVSVVGRSTAGVAVEGDYELVELGLAVAVFLFLPECYLKRGHIVVDLFTSGFQKQTIRLLDSFSDLLFLVVAGVLTWRLSIAGYESFDYREQTMILELPQWWVFVVGVFSTTLMAFCAAHRLVQFVRRPK